MQRDDRRERSAQRDEDMGSESGRMTVDLTLQTDGSSAKSRKKESTRRFPINHWTVRRSSSESLWKTLA